MCRALIDYFKFIHRMHVDGIIFLNIITFSVEMIHELPSLKCNG